MLYTVIAPLVRLQGKRRCFSRGRFSVTDDDSFNNGRTVLVGYASQGNIELIIYALLAVGEYVLLFICYARQMRQRNCAYEEAAHNQS